MKKIIGLTEPSIFTDNCIDLIENYYDAIPLKLSQNKPEDLTYCLEEIRKSGGGVFLAGGPDLYCGTYNQQLENGEGLDKFDIRRDKRELFILDYVAKKDVPCIAACRGFQIASIFFGLANSFIKDISNSQITHSPGNSNMKLNQEQGELPHWVTCFDNYKNSYFKRDWVVSAHHQAVWFSREQYEAGVYEDQNNINVVGIADLNITNDKKKKQDIIELFEGKETRIWAAQYHFESVNMWKFNKNPASLSILEKFKQAMQ
jgi:gamma-glutamyl-gamma-aminobutyrate hydrolase PuuD